MSSTPSAESLPAQFDHTASQSKWYAFWESRGYFHAEPDPAKKPYTIVIPPPNVTGALHLGHALNNSLQDILIRMKRMQGFNALWMPGTDHAGIATQAVVEKRLFEEEKLTRHDLGRDQLVARIWKWKEEYEARILGQLKQMGFSCDWERTRFTLDPICAKAVRQTFFGLFRDGLIYRGNRLVNWDTYLQTTVSDDELFHETVKGHFWHFKYPVVNPLPGEPNFVEIATTRPETMLGDTAVAVHPDPAGAFDRTEADLKAKLKATPEKERAAIKQQLEALQKRRMLLLPQLEKLRDMALAGRTVMLPLLSREIPIIADEWAKPELGTGCVKITPAHDHNDYEVGKRAGLPMINILNADGTLNHLAGPYQGLTVQLARKCVVADLDTIELLGEVENREIDLAHSDRSKTPIEPYLADQWFVKMDRLAQSAMDAVTSGKVTITPERYAKGYLDWLSEKRDWPIGRQLWWGHQIPIWSKEVFNESDLTSAQQNLNSEKSIQTGEAFYQIELNEERSPTSNPKTVQGAEVFTHAFATLHVCIAKEDAVLEEHITELGYTRQQDVLDTWFSSALWPHSTLGWPEKTLELAYFYPTQTLITSRDIITLWVARMVLAGIFNLGEVPFSNVFIHPKILDGNGQTMSKSKGNGVDPLDVIEKFGADALRFGLAYLTTETQDVRMPVEFECPHCNALVPQTTKNRTEPTIECLKCCKRFRTQWAKEPNDMELPRGAVVSERFELGRNFANKLWNASRFVMMNLEGYSQAKVSESDLTVEDRWILSRLATVTQQTTEALETFHFAEAARFLYDFAWEEFCSFYLEMCKPRLAEETSRATAQRMLVHVLDQLMRLLHPFMPFLTEEVWQHLANFAPKRGIGDAKTPSESIMIATWPIADTTRSDEKIETQFALFQRILGAVREIRSRQSISPKEALKFSVRCDVETQSLLKPMEPYFISMARAEPIAWGESVTPPAISASVTLPGMDVYVDVSGFLDLAAEQARLTKEHGQLLGRIQGIEKKLENEAFVSRAPAEVVAGEKARLLELQEQLTSIDQAITQLEALAGQQ